MYIAAGQFHTLVQTNDSAVWGFGRNFQVPAASPHPFQLPISKLPISRCPRPLSIRCPLKSPHSRLAPGRTPSVNNQLPNLTRMARISPYPQFPQFPNATSNPRQDFEIINSHTLNPNSASHKKPSPKPKFRVAGKPRSPELWLFQAPDRSRVRLVRPPLWPRRHRVRGRL